MSCNISDNVSGWGIIPLPSVYKARAGKVYEGEFLSVSVLDPIDFVFGKLVRGTEDDFQDATKIISRYSISSGKLIEHKKLISLPKDPETLLFKKKFEHLMELIDPM